ncbi:calponin homology domain-containing protein [Sphaerosporella brunnea]|uniref:Calponin homology domain-containing protein n=1 Tax=Sphaerosporella brunnea TaxID=1250544 RepID=A0A5J5EQW4_9PEZI|nr:calponin homology domain-containing protein [Sphaerosporella brunnea]
MGESRQELLNWLNSLLQLNITRVEQCGTGAAFCQVLDSIYGDVPMHKIKFNARAEYEYINNFKVLTVYFAQKGIDRPIEIQKLVKCKMQDNLEFLQWTKKYWDQNYPGGDYDALGRRKGAPAVIGGQPKEPIRSNAGAAAKRGTTPTVGAAARTRTPLGGNTAVLQQENAQLKESLVGLEKERDFYFSKLRDIELLIQQAVEENPDLEKDPNGLIPAIQATLYSTEEGFVIPDDQAEEEETF